MKNLALNHNPRIAVVGIGAELNGDDAIGLLTARKLFSAMKPGANLMVQEGGALPENFSGPLRCFEPDLAIFIDAADLGATPGTIEIVTPDRIGGASFSTHSMPMKLLMDYLAEELHCETLLIGVQPEGIEFGTAITAVGKRAATLLAKEIGHQLADVVMC